MGPGGEPASEFAIDSLAARRDPSGPAIVAHVRNSGGRALDLSGQAMLTGGPGRLSAGPFAAKGLTLGMGESGDVIFPLDPAIPAAAWDVSVTLASGQVQHVAQARVDIPAANESARPPVAAHRAGDSSTSAAILVAGAVLLAACGVVILMRRRRRAGRQPT